jgi:hypothetical protein
MGEWSKLHNEEHRNVYSSPTIIRLIKSRRMGGGGACGMHGREEESTQGFNGKARRKDPHGRPRRG